MEPWTLDPAGERDAVLLEARGEVGADLGGDEPVTPLVRAGLERFLEHALDRVGVDDHLLHLALGEQLLELAVRDDRDPLRAGPQVVHQQHPGDREEQVQKLEARQGVHPRAPSAGSRMAGTLLQKNAGIFW